MAVFDVQHPWVFAFGILGNLVSIFVYFAPLPTFRRICREKSTMGFQCVPYVVALFSAMLWMYYALLKNAILLISINSLGCFIETIYITVYIVYAPKEARKEATKLVSMLNVGAFLGIFVVTRFALKEETVRVAAVGWICVAFSVSVFAAPLSIVFQVIRTRSAEFMPFALSFALTVSAIMWFSYGLLTKDICVAVPNTVGFVLGVVQMLLYGIYRNPKPLEDSVEKKTPAEHVINIVMLANSDQVHPLDPEPTANCHVSSNHADDHQLQKTSPSHHHSNHKGIGDEGHGDDDDNDPRPCSVPAQVNIAHLLDSPALVACPA